VTSRLGDLVHVVAECADCNFRTENYLNGYRSAVRHSKCKGHLVRIDLGYVFAVKDGVRANVQYVRGR